MSVAIITGSCGLVGSEAARYFAGLGMDVVGIDNDLRAYFFGPDASTAWNRTLLQRQLPNYHHVSLDIRDQREVCALFRRYQRSISLIIHTAAQPSHDWAAREPVTDFDVNARATLLLLEAARQHAPDAPFIYMSTNKVYGDRPNSLPLQELETRWELPSDHPYYHGIDESMSIDASLHSLFGASKLAADVLVQEYGRYFGMPTVSFRGGCLTGPAHSGAQLHGFLAYLVHCAVARKPYTIFGYGGKQVRDNIHSHDLVRAFDAYRRAPRPGEVYNMGGSRFSNCSVLEAVRLAEELSGNPMVVHYHEQNRVGDHIWWITSVEKFRQHYPGWTLTYNLRTTVQEICDAQRERLKQS
ncbi:MAG: NAD-dependent epimerase/dehydratase family protein [Armatimonadota bacterium]|nr:NAD-dependent epimerase/dehydratase family protein [Armatimonadota bacterium]